MATQKNGTMVIGGQSMIAGQVVPQLGRTVALLSNIARRNRFHDLYPNVLLTCYPHSADRNLIE